MIDKIITLAPATIGQKIGRLEDGSMAQVNQALGRFLGMQRA